MQISTSVVGEIVTWCSNIAAIEEAWLYGSRAKGTAHEKSDIDVAVVLKSDDDQDFAEWVENGDE